MICCARIYCARRIRFLGSFIVAAFTSVAAVYAAGPHTHALAGLQTIHRHLKQSGEMLPGLDHFFDDVAVREPLLTLAGGDKDRIMPLVRFDMTEIPPATRIRKATLWLYLDRCKNTPSGEVVVEAVRLEQPWTAGAEQSDAVEGAKGKAAANGEVTWRRWININPLPLPAISSAILNSDAPPGRWIAWDVTAAARRWLSKPRENYGLAIRVADRIDASGARWQFIASEALDSHRDGLGGGTRLAYRPMLIVMPE